MRLDLYQNETTRIAVHQKAILDDASRLLHSGERLSPLEENGVLHALQVLIENAIGKGKQWLKASGQPVPLSAYDTFASLAQNRLIPHDQLNTWNALIGIRNRIVHDYMNVDMNLIQELVKGQSYDFIFAYLMQATPEGFDKGHLHPS